MVEKPDQRRSAGDPNKPNEVNPALNPGEVPAEVSVGHDGRISIELRVSPVLQVFMELNPVDGTCSVVTADAEGRVRPYHTNKAETHNEK